MDRRPLLLVGLLLPFFAGGVYRILTTQPIEEGAAAVPDGAGRAGTGTAGAKPVPAVLRIDPNTAEWWELAALPGIGEVLAGRIVEHREQHRPEDAAARPVGVDQIAGSATSAAVERVFRSVADLERVKGIGPKTAARLAPYLMFGPDPSSTEP